MNAVLMALISMAPVEGSVPPILVDVDLLVAFVVVVDLDVVCDLAVDLDVVFVLVVDLDVVRVAINEHPHAQEWQYEIPAPLA